MSFLKKHWRFTVPAVVVLCVLLLGAVVLYTTSETPEPKRVYAMPERSPDNPPPINTGGRSTIETPPSAETTGETESLETEVANDTENLEACCPEEHAHVPDNSGLSSEDSIVHVSPEAIADAQRYRAWQSDHDEYLKRYKAIEEKGLAWIRKMHAHSNEFYATLSPSDRAAIRAGLSESEEARKWWPTLFDDETPARSPDSTLYLGSEALLSEGAAIQNQLSQLSPPEPLLHYHTEKK